MGYYRGATGDYYSGRGDYYSGRGDFWSKAKKKIKKLGRVAVPVAANYLTGGMASSFLPQAGAAGGLSQILGGVARTVANQALDKGMAKFSGSTYVPASEDNPLIPNVIEGLWDGKQRKRRTMNPANVNALRRSLRRVDAFRNLAKKSGALPAARRLPPQRTKACCK